jgi:hypothetical protein
MLWDVVKCHFGQHISPIFKGQNFSLDILTLEDGSDTQSRNVNNKPLSDTIGVFPNTGSKEKSVVLVLIFPK